MDTKTLPSFRIESQIWNVSRAQNSQQRRDSLLRSYLWLRNAEFIGVAPVHGIDQVLFKYKNQVLHLPMNVFRYPAWARTCLERSLLSAEAFQ